MSEQHTKIDLDKYTLCLSDWHTPATDYSERQIGDYRIHHSRYRCGVYDMNGIDDLNLILTIMKED